MDLFDFSNADNLLGADPIPSPHSSSILNPPRDHRSQSSPRSYAPTVNNDADVAAAEKKQKTKKPQTYKVAIIGDPQVGKTTFLTNHLNGSFNASYHATIGASTFNLQFNTNLDSHIFEVYDVAGQNLFVGKRDRWYQDICGAIIMYDVMNWGSYENVTAIWLKELKDKAPSGIPIVIVGNKMENRDTRKVSVEAVAEAIQNTFAPDRIGYCEISVKTNQNLAEPFLFLTKRILNINDSKALYFVSKISELNLIESMLKQKSDQELAESKQPPTDKGKDASSSKDLGNLFLTETLVNTDHRNTKKGGDYLDDIIFRIGDDNAERKEKDTKKSKANVQRNDDDGKFLADMMASSTRTKPAVSVSKTPKVTSINAKKQSTAQPQRHRASSNVTIPNSKRPKSVLTQTKTKQQSKSKAQKRMVSSATDNQGVLIDLLLGLQETLNHVQSDIRRLQGDVSYLKQEKQRNKSQRK